MMDLFKHVCMGTKKLKTYLNSLNSLSNSIILNFCLLLIMLPKKDDNLGILIIPSHCSQHKLTNISGIIYNIL